MRLVVQVLAALCFVAIVGAVIFGAAGRTDLPWVWAFLALHAAFLIAFMLVLPRELLRERLNPPAEGRLHDHHRKLVLPLIVASWVLAGADLGRLHWSDTVPLAIRIVAFVVYSIGMGVSIWAVISNRFYSSVVRIQHDRGQRPVTTGPYRFVRHPGYVGTILAILAGGPALGSWIAVVPLIAAALLFVRRTVNEDRLLRRELAGYDAYAATVRHRLVPGIW